MADADEPREGLVGWIRLGCTTAALALVPTWLVLTGLLVHAWGPERWMLAGVVAAVGLVVTSLLVLLAMLVGRVLARVSERRAARRRAERYDAIVGDGSVLRKDAWEEE